MKKYLSILLAVIMVLAIGAAAFAESTEAYDYEVNDDGSVTVTKYYGEVYQCDVVPNIGGKFVTAIGDSTFENHPDGSNHTGWTTEYSYVCEQDFSDEGFSSLESTPVFLYNHRLYGIRTLSGVGTCFCAYPLGSQFSAKQVEKSIKLKTNTYLASAFDQQRGFYFYLDWFYARIDGVSTLVIGIFSLQLNLPEWEFALFQQIPTSDQD